MIGVVGDHQPANETHRTLGESLDHAGAAYEWVPTEAVPDDLADRYSGLWIAPASPYRSMDGALGAIREARERGLPLVGT